MRMIVLAVDGSAHSTRAASMAGELSGAMRVPVNVLHVVPEGKRLIPSESVKEYSDLEHINLTHQDLLEAAGAQIVAEAQRVVAESGGSVSTADVRSGAAAHEIANYVKDHEADCIVMGRRGLGDLEGLFMGSVSNKVGQLTPVTLVTTE